MNAAIQELRAVLARHLPHRRRARKPAAHPPPAITVVSCAPMLPTRQRSLRRAATSGGISMVDLGLDGALPLMDAASFVMCPPGDGGSSVTSTRVPPTPVNSSNESESGDSGGESSAGMRGWKRARATAEF